MAIAYIDPSADEPYAGALVYRNPTSVHELVWSQDGVTGPDATGLNSKFYPLARPYGLGNGKTITTAGQYVYHGELGPAAEQFVIKNDGPQTVYAGVNAASGEWSVANSLPIASGESFEFGSNGSQLLQNVWVITSTGTTTVQGYATNAPSHYTLN